MVRAGLRAGAHDLGAPLPPGTKTTARTATYDDRHVRRLTLLRVLRSVGANPVNRLRTLVEATEDTRLSVRDMLARTTDALAPDPPPEATPQARALAGRILDDAGWSARRPDAADRDNLAAALEAVRLAMPRVPVEAATRAYARLADDLARLEIASPGDDGDREHLLEQMVVGTVLFERALTVLRRLAEEQHSAERSRGRLWADATPDAQRRRCRAFQHAVCQCRRSSMPCPDRPASRDGTTGQATTCGVAGRMVWSQPGQR